MNPIASLNRRRLAVASLVWPACPISAVASTTGSCACASLVPVVFHVFQAFPDVDLADAAVGAEGAEAAGMKREWRPEFLLQAHYLADHDQVIAGAVQRIHTTIKAAQRAREVRVALEFVGGAPRESQREFALLMAQHVDREHRPGSERGDAAAVARQAPQEQRWFQ